jgi:hypothetical protein
VLVRDFVLEPARSGPRREIAWTATTRFDRALRADARLACVDSVDVEGAPPAFQSALYDYALEGTLACAEDKITRITVRAVFARNGHEVASFASACEGMSVHGAAIDAAAIDAVAQRIAESLAQRPWSTSVLDKAERVLIIGGGPETGIELGEELIVRRLQAGNFERGIESWLEVPSIDVARIVVESFVGSSPTQRGAQCRLKGGSIGFFLIEELVVAQEN